MRIARDTDWSQERIDRLTELVKAGVTYNKIAAELGVTKSSAVGKSHRLDLERRGNPIGNGGSTCSNRDLHAHKAKRFFAPKNPARTAPNFKPLQAAGVPPKMLARVELEPIRPSRNLSLAELRGNDCRFPTSSGRPHRFCGNPTKGGKSPYCRGLSQVAEGGGTKSERQAIRTLERHQEADIKRIAA